MRAPTNLRPWVAAALISIASTGVAQSDIGYDPDADPSALLHAAEGQAAADGKFVLVVAGGDWCIWCHYLHAFLDDNADIDRALEDTFVVVKAYYGDNADNSAFFAKLPKAAGYPHFWVLDSDGEVLVSQNTLPLEDGDKSYDREHFLDFIDRWSHELP